MKKLIIPFILLNIGCSRVTFKVYAFKVDSLAIVPTLGDSVTFKPAVKRNIINSKIVKL